MLVSQSPGAQSKPISLSKQQKHMYASTRRSSPSLQAAMRARHSRWGTGIFCRENSTGSSINSLFSLKTWRFIERPKTQKDHTCIGRDKASKICYTSNVHLKTSKSSGKEEEEHSRDRKQEQTLPKQNGQMAGAPTIPVLSFPPPASSQGLVAVRIKKVSPPRLWWVFNHAGHSWQQCTTFYSHSVSFTLPFRDSVAPSLPNTMPSAHKPCHSKGPIGLQAGRTEETSKRSLCCCTITMEDPQTQTGGKARGTAINITSFKRAHRERLITLADLNIWIIAVAFL